MQPRVYINWGHTRPAIVGVSRWNAREVRLCLIPRGPFAIPFYRIWHREHDCCVTRNSRVFNSMRRCRRGQGTVRVEEEWHEKTMLLALDEGDTTTTTERALIAQEEDEDVSGTEGMPTRKSTRSRKRAKDNNFVFVLIFMSCQRHFKAKIRVGNKTFVANYNKHDLTLQTIHTRKSGWKGSWIRWTVNNIIY